MNKFAIVFSLVVSLFTFGTICAIIGIYEDNFYARHGVKLSETDYFKIASLSLWCAVILFCFLLNSNFE